MRCQSIVVSVTAATWVIKLFLCSTQLSTKFFLLINVKMPTIFLLINVKMPTIAGIIKRLFFRLRLAYIVIFPAHKC